MTQSARAAALRSTALAASLALAVGLSAWAAAAAAKPTVPLPKPRPIARNLAPRNLDKNLDKNLDRNSAKNLDKNLAKSLPAPRSTGRNTAPPVKSSLAAPVIEPATRQHAALPPPPARKPLAPAAMAATASTPQADVEALENVIELLRSHKPADATQAEAAISDPVARKLAEWLVLRSDDNGA